MANVEYLLYGQTFSESQGKMMARVFEAVLSRYPEKTAEAVKKFACLSVIDYEQDIQALLQASSAFLNKTAFQIAGQKIYIGTSYGMKQKLSYIRRLFALCGEDENQFQLYTEEALKPNCVIQQPEPSSVPGKERFEEISYRLFDRNYTSNQAEMLYRAFAEILRRKPEVTDWAIDHLHCVSRVDAAAGAVREKKEEAAWLNQSRLLRIDGKSLRIGSGYNLKAKLSLIDRLRQRAEMPSEIFEIFFQHTLTDGQKEAITSVENALRISEQKTGWRGVVYLPTGTGKTKILTALFARLLSNAEVGSVLLLTNNISLAKQYEQNFAKTLGQAYTVKLAQTRNDLRETAGRSGTILISAVQKLIGTESSMEDIITDTEIPSYSDSSKLLVVAEEISYSYSGRIYADMNARFPNAAFLGITAYLTPETENTVKFGPVLYRYTLEQIYKEKMLRPVDYYDIAADQKLSDHPELLAAKAKIVKESLRWSGKDAFALLLCENHDAAFQFYDSLQEMGIEVRLNLYQRYDWPETEREISPDIRWDQSRFGGVVIANYPPDPQIGRFDLIFLDKQIKSGRIAQMVWFALAAGDVGDAAAGTLIDFRNGLDAVEKLLPESFPLHICQSDADLSKDIAAITESLRTDLQALSRELMQNHFAAAQEVLAGLEERFPAEGNRLSEELAFLFDPAIMAERQEHFWEQHRTELEWKTRLWCLLSKESQVVWKLRKEEQTEQEEDGIQEQSDEPVFPAPAAQNPQESGHMLERSVAELIRRLYGIDEAESLEVLENLHVQGSGIQFGFDVAFTYQDRFGVSTTCRVECKNYHNTRLRVEDIAPKLASLQHLGKKIDHWILISPHGQISNELAEMWKPWQESFRWEPIRDIQLWTKEENVEELFALFPDLYEQYFGSWADSEASGWDTVKKEKIIRYWKGRLAPVPKLPASWRDYLKTPAKLLTQFEGDLETSVHYEGLYENYVPLRLTDEDGFSMEGTAEDYFLQWLQQPDTDSALLLGDFGDGKTFFTYTLARKLAKQFLESPAAGWIPLRLSLRDHQTDSRQFLDSRLREFGSSLAEWNDVQRRYHVFVILDGLDEMSLGMDDTEVLENLGRLEELLEQFCGHKILVTSRKMVIYTDKVREQIMECLDHPNILHLAAVARGERLQFLEQSADTPQRRASLRKMKSTHDLLGLAAKPLFLEMTQAMLDRDGIENWNMVTIYQNYAEKVLRRKYEKQLRYRGVYRSRRNVISSLLRLLGELALCLQIEGVESISLDRFQLETGQGNFAELLWSTVRAPEADADARNRIKNRSLLKYDNLDADKVCFCHRSMKEYFVACGLVGYLSTEAERAKRYLLECSFGYEILEFAGMLIQQQGMEAQERIINKLHEFAHEAKKVEDEELCRKYARLGTNCVNLIRCAGSSLHGLDWNGLLLDNVILSGMDLAGKNFSHSSLRYAHFDNADLSGCDLRGCDFTGVQFEKSGQLASFGLLADEPELLAGYKDGNIRCWDIRSGTARTLARFKAGENGRLILQERGKEGMIQPDMLQFWRRSEQRLERKGYVVPEDRVHILDLGRSAALVWKRGMVYLLELASGTAERCCETAEDVRACLLDGRSCLIFQKEKGLKLFDFSQGESWTTWLPWEDNVTALKYLDGTEAGGRLAAGTKDGRLRICQAERTAENGRWSIADAAEYAIGDEAILNIDSDEMGGLYIGVSNGSIIRYRNRLRGEWAEDRIYRLELKCSGAQIEGVFPPEQYEILRRAAAEN